MMTHSSRNYTLRILSPTSGLILILSLSLALSSSSSVHAFLILPTSSSKSHHYRHGSLFAKASKNRKEKEEEVVPTKNIKPKGVTLKVAFDLNWGVGEGAENAPTSERFTGPESLDMVHRLRRDSDAVLVGRGTVDRDDCSLTVRRGVVPMIENHEQPLRVILDPRLSLIMAEMHDGVQYKIFSDGFPTVIYHSVPDVDLASLTTISEQVSVVYMPFSGDIPDLPKETREQNRPSTFVSPNLVLDHLKTHFSVQHLMVEGGPITANNFLTEGLIDRAILVKAPVSFQDPVPSGMTEATFQKAGLEMIGSKRSGDDTIEYWARPGESWPGDSIENWP